MMMFFYFIPVSYLYLLLSLLLLSNFFNLSLFLSRLLPQLKQFPQPWPFILISLYLLPSFLLYSFPIPFIHQSPNILAMMGLPIEGTGYYWYAGVLICYPCHFIFYSGSYIYRKFLQVWTYFSTWFSPPSQLNNATIIVTYKRAALAGLILRIQIIQEETWI